MIQMNPTGRTVKELKSLIKEIMKRSNSKDNLAVYYDAMLRFSQSYFDGYPKRKDYEYFLDYRDAIYEYREQNKDAFFDLYNSIPDDIIAYIKPIFAYIFVEFGVLDGKSQTNDKKAKN